MNECVEENVLQELLKLLKLEKIEENIFRGQSQDLGFHSVFGGQVLGQALSAASRTVPEERQAHSLHGYFMRPGDSQLPIVYTVECIRDGKSFTTRRVVAIQKGRAIFSMSVSFQVKEEGFGHQDAMPEVPGPDGLESQMEMAERYADKIPSAIRSRILCAKPIEIRQIDPIDPFAPDKRLPIKHVWFRAIDPIGNDMSAHKYLLAYASDFNLLGTSLYPHGCTFWDPRIQMASLDHAMWFHREFRMDDWLLYTMESPSASKARGLSIGRIFTQKGDLVATVTQEGLIRYRQYADGKP